MTTGKIILCILLAIHLVWAGYITSQVKGRVKGFRFWLVLWIAPLVGPLLCMVAFTISEVVANNNIKPKDKKDGEKDK